MKPRPWSHSSLTDFHNCPKAFYEKRVARSVVEQANDAGRAGDFVHKAFEAYLTSGVPLPAGYPEDVAVWPKGVKPPAHYQSYLDAIQGSSGEMHVECKYALTSALQPCTFDATDAWCRAIIDVLHLDGSRARVLDHKTGKRKADGWQLKLNAMLVFAHHPEVDVVKTGYVWLQSDDLDTAEYRREYLGFMWQEYAERLHPYNEAFRIEQFPPRPSGLCNGWCPVQQCAYWKPKREWVNR